MIIVNNVLNTETINFETLKSLKFNELKNNERDVKELVSSIESNGFISPMFLYEKDNYIIDGKGRYLALIQLELKGYAIPDIPVVKIKADSLKIAKKIVLAINSKYGDITKQSLDQFLIEFSNEELEELKISGINLIELDTKLQDIKLYENQLNSKDNNEIYLNDLDIMCKLTFEFKDLEYLEILELLTKEQNKQGLNSKEETLIFLLKHEK